MLILLYMCAVLCALTYFRYAFIEFHTKEHAVACQKAMDGFVVAGRCVLILILNMCPHTTNIFLILLLYAMNGFVVAGRCVLMLLLYGPHTTMCYYCACPHTTMSVILLSSYYYYICVLILL